jgi:hypothetical protein
LISLSRDKEKSQSTMNLKRKDAERFDKAGAEKKRRRLFEDGSSSTSTDENTSPRPTSKLSPRLSPRSTTAVSPSSPGLSLSSETPGEPDPKSPITKPPEPSVTPKVEDHEDKSPKDTKVHFWLWSRLYEVWISTIHRINPYPADKMYIFL